MPVDLVQVLTGATVTALRRRSKYLLADLDRGGTLLMHLGMSGRMLVQGGSLGDFHRDPAILPRHDHVVLVTDGGSTITFNDARRFGMVDLIREGSAHPLLDHLGPEPFDEAFTPAYLAGAFAGRRVPVKQALLDQRIVAGLGNIYVSEALHRAGIDPRRAAGRIGAARIAALVGHIRDVLTDAIAAGGSSLRDHRQASGELGISSTASASMTAKARPAPPRAARARSGGSCRAGDPASSAPAASGSALGFPAAGLIGSGKTLLQRDAVHGL